MILLEMMMGYFGPAVAIMIWLITGLASWRVFCKADIAGWKALIPVYREYNLFCIAWDKKKFLEYLIIAMIAGILEVAADLAGEGSLFGMAGAIIDLGVIYFEVLLKINLARAFGRGRLFGLFLYFLEPIAMAGLGFGPDEYIGPMGVEEEQGI